MSEPRHKPPYGVHFPCTITRVVDGDTVIVSFGSKRKWRIRLLSCWVPDKDKDVNERAKEQAKEFVATATKASVLIPTDEDCDDPLVELTTMSRILAYVYLNEKDTLNRLMVTAGLASTTKGGELGR